jgi:hypothetical protein
MARKVGQIVAWGTGDGSSGSINGRGRVSLSGLVVAFLNRGLRNRADAQTATP